MHSRQVQLGQTVFWAVASCKGHKEDFLANFDFAGGKY